MGQNIRVFALRLGQVRSDIRRELPLIGNVNEGLLAGC